MADQYSQDNNKIARKNPKEQCPLLHCLPLILFLSCFFIIFPVPVYAETNPLKTHIVESFKEYEKSIYNNYSSIEFIDIIEYKEVTNNTCITHYIKKAYYRMDLKKERLFIRLLKFHLIDGKNVNNRYAGMEIEKPLKELYLFSEYIDRRWDQTYINEEESYVSFKGTKWFIPLYVSFNYDKETYFPKQLSVSSEDRNINIFMKYSKHSEIYMLDEIISNVTFNFFLIHYSITAYVTRTHYVIR